MTLKTIYKPAIPESEISTEDNQSPGCPWCGFEHYENYWEFQESIYECENCGKEFEVKYVYRYTTEKYEEDKQ